MYKFTQFVEAREIVEVEDLPVPPGVDPAMWANPSYRRFWLAQNQPQTQVQTPVVPQQTPIMPQKRVGKALGGALPDPATLGSNHHLVARNLSLAMSPAGAMNYPFYWSDKERRAKPNPYYKG